MAKAKLHLRDLTGDEQKALERLTRSRTAPARLVERARLVWQAHRGLSMSEIARRLGLSRVTVYEWIKRFNATGISGLNDQARSGRPSTYSPEQVAEVIATALMKPDRLGLPYASWTLDRLEQYLNEQRGSAIKRSRIDELLLAEGLRWRSQETWFGERVDPAFAEKRGQLKNSTPPPRKAA